MIRVISSPSSSTTGLVTLIFAIWDSARIICLRNSAESAIGYADMDERMADERSDREVMHTGATAPVVVLVEPQLGQNIGMAARAMGNFGLSELRIVNPRDGWTNFH